MMPLLSTHTLSVGITADDLISAADGGSPFASKGLKVAEHHQQGWTTTAIPDVVAIDCASRSMSPDSAAQTIGAATQSLASASLLFKTIDSALTGHIREQLQAAFPDVASTTVNGAQYVEAIPVDASVYGHNNAHPVATSKIAYLIPEDINDLRQTNGTV